MSSPPWYISLSRCCAPPPPLSSVWQAWLVRCLPSYPQARAPADIRHVSALSGRAVSSPPPPRSLRQALGHSGGGWRESYRSQSRLSVSRPSGVARGGAQIGSRHCSRSARLVRVATHPASLELCMPWALPCPGIHMAGAKGARASAPSCLRWDLNRLRAAGYNETKPFRLCHLVKRQLPHWRTVMCRFGWDFGDHFGPSLFSLARGRWLLAPFRASKRIGAARRGCSLSYGSGRSPGRRSQRCGGVLPWALGS